MTDKDKIRRAMTWAVKQCYGGFIYEKWSHELRLETVKNSREEFLKYIKEHLDWNDIDKETCKLLGFGRWSDDMPDLWLIPGYLYPIIPIGLKVKSISGDESTWTGKEDNDVRFGCLAYGIEVEKRKENNMAELKQCPYTEEEKEQELKKLESCPFCSSEATFLNTIDYRPMICAQCHNCGASSGLYWSKKEAIDAWNKRS